MKWNEYLPLAEKTLSKDFYTDPFYEKILHAVMGSLTEVEEILILYKNGELTKSIQEQGSLAEECADIYWYLSILFRELEIDEDEDVDTTDLSLEDAYSTLISFTIISLRFLDGLKKKIYYNKEMDRKNMKILSKKLFKILNHYCGLYSINISEILDKNISKLRVRYGDKFSTDRAINRDLETEKKILESTK